MKNNFYMAYLMLVNWAVSWSLETILKDYSHHSCHLNWTGQWILFSLD